MVQRDRGIIKCNGLTLAMICPEGKIPVLEPRNRELWSLFEQMLPGLIRGMGGYDYRAIRAVFAMNQVNEEAQRHMLPTIISLIDVIEKARKVMRNQ